MQLERVARVLVQLLDIKAFFVRVSAAGERENWSTAVSDEYVDSSTAGGTAPLHTVLDAMHCSDAQLLRSHSKVVSLVNARRARTHMEGTYLPAGHYPGGPLHVPVTQQSAATHSTASAARGPWSEGDLPPSYPSPLLTPLR